MKKTFLILALLVSACGETRDTQNWRDRPGAREEFRGSNDSVQLAQLTGLYEAASNDQQSRMCMKQERSGATTFGLVIATRKGACSGAGNAVRTGSTVRLKMVGDQECVIEATMDGPRITFSVKVPPSCAYYCAPGETLSAKTFEKTGGTTEDAMRALDLAGDPLCA